MRPCYKYIDNTIDMQIMHIRQESKELLDAMLDKKYHHALEELMDLKQSVATCEEIFRRHGYDTEAAELNMINKNETRGNYDKPIRAEISE